MSRSLTGTPSSRDTESEQVRPRISVTCCRGYQEMSCRISLRECRMAWSTSHAQGVLSRWPDPSLRDVKLAYRKDTKQHTDQSDFLLSSLSVFGSLRHGIWEEIPVYRDSDR